uniref:Glycosyltransferase family 4 protein n=1 Tax=Tetraselmis sp. GSL018 TaxID=582737 RepID=A0A061SL83_9CHLO
MYGQKMLPATSKLARPHLKILGKAVQRQDNRQAFRLRCQRPFRALSKSAEANIPDGTTFRENRAVIVSPLWPERSSSAAGVRTWGLIDLFESWLWKISYLSPAKPNSYTDELQARGIDTYSIRPNRRDELQRVLRAVKPTVCVFDRHASSRCNPSRHLPPSPRRPPMFLFSLRLGSSLLAPPHRFFAEEAFSFVVRETCPEALRVLDTQDLHFLRAGRQEQAARSSEPDACISEVMGHLPSAESAALLRELAAVHRSDVCMACSPVEAALLSERYGVDRRKVLLSSFLCDPPDTGGNPGFASRQHFVTIGNFRHPPNADSVEWLTCGSGSEGRSGRGGSAPRCTCTGPTRRPGCGRCTARSGGSTCSATRRASPSCAATAPAWRRCGSARGSRGRSSTAGRTDSPCARHPSARRDSSFPTGFQATRGSTNGSLPRTAATRN